MFRLMALSAGELPLVSIDDSPARSAQGDSNIPPFVYQTWSSNRLGRTHARQMARFREINPELSFSLYSDAKMDEYMKVYWGTHEIGHIFRKARYPQLAADIFRYCLIYHLGGFYFDISKGVDVPICSLLQQGSTGLITYEHRLSPAGDARDPADEQPFRDNVVAQFGFGFAKGHPLLKMVIDKICESYPLFRGMKAQRPKDAILSFTGPDMFTGVVRDYLARTKDVHLTQAGVDFHGAAIWRMKGSYVRFLSTPPYKYARDDAIVD